MPAACLLLLNLASVYPFDGERTSAFVYPSVFLLIVAGLERGWKAVARGDAWVERLGVLAVLAPIAACGYYAFGQVRQQAAGVEDVAAVVDFLRLKSEPGDLVYLHPSVAEQSRLYFRMARWEPRNLVVGAGAWPCCAKGKPNVHRTPGARVVAADFIAAFGRSETGAVWFVHTARPVHWESVGLDEPAAVLESLPEAGCRNIARLEFTGVAVSRIQCYPSADSGAGVAGTAPATPIAWAQR